MHHLLRLISSIGVSGAVRNVGEALDHRRRGERAVDDLAARLVEGSDERERPPAA